MRHPILGLVAPSGGGKSTLILATVRRFPDRLAIVKSLTTRPRRGPEDDAFYDFVSVEEMRRREAAGELVQVSEYAGHLYAHERTQDRVLADRIGICALVEGGVLKLREAGYDVRVVQVIPTDTQLHPDPARRAADKARTKIKLEPELTIHNSFAPGGLERSVEDLSLYLTALL